MLAGRRPLAGVALDKYIPVDRAGGCFLQTPSRSEGMVSELSTLKEERDVIRTRVTDMLEQLEALNL